MKFIQRTLTFFLITVFSVSFAQNRKIIHFPDIDGYQTLKCDFHMHTVFSDGNVWPTVRLTEAWKEGLDAIAITDHIEYRPHADDVVSDHNRSYTIAKPLADELKIILIKGTEITRSMPPGHMNALFISDANPIDTKDVFDAVGEAQKQGTFLLWNHPGWKAQQPDTTLWWDDHTKLYNNKMLNGIEVFNGDEFYPEALGWAQEKNLTLFGNTDSHDPIDGNKLRTMTLVFAKDKTAEGIREALNNRRTIAYSENRLAGDADLLHKFFFASLKFDNGPLKLVMKGRTVVYIQNNSDITYELELEKPNPDYKAPESLILKPHEITPLILSGNTQNVNDLKQLTMIYKVKNVFVAGNQVLNVTFNFKNN